ncbi:MAG TPA: pentapeptide repeat-containing protein [Planctomycetota bacterium]|nr:pentapeptide repeat-containing protein [Planctomycetota bacterium]HRR79106.1 pentapeptide repeat-containing protein [Planctomycetota bacterium]HRT93161.1 pentapeptide repeat-containing protein [Planctomycetota bacterium]
MWDDKTCSYEGCSEPAWGRDPNRLCLCHSPANGEDEHDARAFWRRARHETAQAAPNYSGWHFPPDPDGKGFEGTSFRFPVAFSHATFAGQAKFTQAVFHGQADFQHVVFGGPAAFDGCEFHQAATFEHSRFVDEASFVRARFSDRVRFRSVFEKNVSFRWAALNGGADLSGSVFHGAADLVYATVPPGADAIFDLPTGLRRPFRVPSGGETAYRLAKEAAIARGDYGAAGDYHYAEQCAAEHKRRQTYGWRPWRLGFWRSLLDLIFARWIFGYGERPARALVMGAAVIILWAFLAYGVAGISRDARGDPGYQPTRLECLHFSIVTFTTVGYGDFQPKKHFMPWADAEALLGAALMSVFIVGLTRKYMR